MAGLPDAAAETVAPLFERILSAPADAYDPWLYQYHGGLTDRAEALTYVRHVRDLLAVDNVDPRGRRVLDAGSGFGFTLVVLAALGAAEVRGIEVHEPMVQTARAYQHLLPPELSQRIDVVDGSVTAVPYPDESFDIILSIEAISHYRDVNAFIRESARLLRPGGVVLVADGNNGLNPIRRRETREVWDAIETGGYTGWLHGHNVQRSFVDERKAFVEARYPDVPAAEMARRTFGMTEDEIGRACERYLRDGALPGSVYDRSSVPVSPGDGIVIERLFNPYELARAFRKAGFRTRTRGYWGGASGRRALRLANDVLARLSPVTMFSARGFRIAARKPP